MTGKGYFGSLGSVTHWIKWTHKWSVWNIYVSFCLSCPGFRRIGLIAETWHEFQLQLQGLIQRGVQRTLKHHDIQVWYLIFDIQAQIIRNYDANVPLLHVLVDSFNPEKIWVIEDHHLVLRAGKSQGSYLKATIIGSLHHGLSNIITANKVNVTQLLHLSPLKTIPTWSYLDQEYCELLWCFNSTRWWQNHWFGSYLRQVKPPIFCSLKVGQAPSLHSPSPRRWCRNTWTWATMPRFLTSWPLNRMGKLGPFGGSYVMGDPQYTKSRSDLDDLGVPPFFVDLSHPSRHFAEKDLKDMWLTKRYIYIYNIIYLYLVGGCC